jgi:predicted nucleic acid-binding protein
MALFRAAVDGAYRLVAPDFMAIELANVLWKYVERELLTDIEARRVLDRFPFDYVEWLPARMLLADAFRLATVHRITVYDAAFLAGAASLAADFVTADRTLHGRVVSRLPWVKLLTDVSA